MKTSSYPLYQHREHQHFNDFLSDCEKRYHDRIALSYRKGKEICHETYSQLIGEQRALSAFLLTFASKGQHIAILGENCRNWILSHMSIVAIGCVAVPLDKDAVIDDLKWMLVHSESRVLILSGSYADLQPQLTMPGLKIIRMDELETCINKGKDLLSNNKVSLPIPAPDDLASIVYTSGTTGRSKGVMLTQQNLTSDIHSACSNVKLDAKTILLLPLHHTFGLTAALYSAMNYGSEIFVPSSMKRLSDDIKLSQPNYIFGVPLIVETLYRSIWSGIRKQGKEKLVRKMISISNCLRKIGVDLRRKFFAQILQALGGHLTLIVSGGAPLNPALIKEFDSLGIDLLNGYGITECAPVVAVNRNRQNIVGSVGIPLCSNEVKLNYQGEILVRGKNVMTGYWKDPDSTASVFRDGWFHTGDLGSIDTNGALYITGRIKNLIILSNGENVSAEALEQKIIDTGLVSEVMVFGENGCITAEIYLNPDVPNAASDIDAAVQNLNLSLPITQRIQSIKLRDTEFPKTSTKKIKRGR